MIISQYTDMAGKIRILWQSPATGEVYHYKFNEEPTTQQLETLSDESDAYTDIQKTPTLTFDLLEYRDQIKTFIEQVKARPNLTLAQYNAYLGSLQWYDAAVIRFFVFVFAVRLAERKDIDLPNQTEANTLQAVRDFIVDTPARKLAKLIFNQTHD
jgi:hypothetical protein